jgi:hypothetical protein
MLINTKVTANPRNTHIYTCMCEQGDEVGERERKRKMERGRYRRRKICETQDSCLITFENMVNQQNE